MWSSAIKLFITLYAVVILFSSSVKGSLDPIVIEGSHFFYQTNGSEFFIRGVAYQQDINAAGGGSRSPSFTDPLADEASCARDIPYLKQLKTNVVRVYSIDYTQDHSACMGLLDDADIYVIVDLTTPTYAIDRDNPTWNLALYSEYTSVIDSMQNYTNVLGFFAGTEVTNSTSTSASSAYVKAAVRDMKNYIKSMEYRSIGVGYSANNDAAIFDYIQDYFNCGDGSSSIDFLGLNIYSWCGDSSFTESGYSELVTALSNYSIPAFFSEYGCNAVQPRTFAEVQVLFGSQMTNVFSGGIVFEYYEEDSEFGLVGISGNTVSTISDFVAYSTQMASISPSHTPSSAYTPTNTVGRSCPTTGSSWLASETLPPTPNSDLCRCMVSSLSFGASSNFNSTVAAAVFSGICGSSDTACSGISSNSTTGQYGAYSVCNVTQQASWAMNQCYLEHDNATAACGFNGLGTAQSPAESPRPVCQSLLAQAGTLGTGTVTSLPAITPTGTETQTTSGSSTTPTGNSGDGGARNSDSSSGGLSAGAIAGIAIAAVVGVLLLGLAFLLWRRKRKAQGPPLSGEGELEVGDAPPQFTALRRAEMEATEAKKSLLGGAAAVHDTHNNRTRFNELDADRERQELDSTEASRNARPSELDGAAQTSETDGAIARNELSGNSTSRSATPRRKPTSTLIPPVPTQTQTSSSASWTNQPWSDPGVEGLGVSSPVRKPTEAEATEAAEMRRLENEEKMIDEAIAESERLQALRKEKEGLQRRRLEITSKTPGDE